MGVQCMYVHTYFNRCVLVTCSNRLRLASTGYCPRLTSPFCTYIHTSTVPHTYSRRYYLRTVNGMYILVCIVQYVVYTRVHTLQYLSRFLTVIALTGLVSKKTLILTKTAPKAIKPQRRILHVFIILRALLRSEWAAYPWSMHPRFSAQKLRRQRTIKSNPYR